jgi:hypothetical protein
MVSFARGGNLDFKSGKATVQACGNVWMTLVSNFHHVGADAVQHVSKQSLGSIAKLDIADLGPQAAEHGSNQFSISTQRSAPSLE